MFYRPGLDDHGLPHNPFKALIAPRPIGWISTIDADGHANLAPYSFFNAISDTPPMVSYASTGHKIGRSEAKDSISNIRASGEFVVNIVPFALRDAMNASSGPYPADIDEFEQAGLGKAPSNIVAPPRVAEAPAALECRVWRIIDLPGERNTLVLGEVLGVYIDPSILVEGLVDVTRYQPLARLGYHDYCAVERVFSLKRPGTKHKSS